MEHVEEASGGGKIKVRFDVGCREFNRRVGLACSSLFFKFELLVSADPR
jgi:hypothetical protein